MVRQFAPLILLLAVCIPSLAEETATDISKINTLEGFDVELVYSVPKKEQGSWVSMCVDPQGNLIVCDQYGKLYRVELPSVTGKKDLVITPMDIEIGGAQGLLWAFDSLYVSVNNRSFPIGIHRVTDSNGDGKLDKVTKLRDLTGGGEHGPHAILKHPDGKHLVITCGNQVEPTEYSSSVVPQVYDEDQILPRVYGRGFMRNKMAPGGYFAKIDPDGKNWELMAVGFRNQYDAAYNRDGELFTYDADMEWDVNTPWYRPTRICHVTSGAEFGWRNGSAKWPAFYEDSVPGIHDIGFGSPTGVTFGYGAKFPQKYQNALYACDWSYGRLYALHLEPDGATYKATKEEFVAGRPLPLTDVCINSHDGAMYFMIGGRKTQSGLYRVTYTGKQPTQMSVQEKQPNYAMKVRRELESFHASKDPAGIKLALHHLGSEDRAIRFAARTVLEHQPADLWQAEALKLTKPIEVINASIAIARTGDKKLRDQVLNKLDAIDYASSDQHQRLALLRAYGLVLVRMSEDDSPLADRYLKRLEPLVPAQSAEENIMLGDLLVRLGSPKAAEFLVGQLETAPTQEEQIAYAKALRLLQDGWNDSLRERYFRWFHRAVTYRGGASFTMFVDEIKKDAVENLSAENKEKLAAIINFQPKSKAPQIAAKQRDFVKKWTVEELAPALQKDLTGRNFEKGRRLFAEASCFACHRFDGQGGAIGPDLTALSGRFSPRDVLESIILPNKQISDQYQAVKILTDDGQVVVGRIVNFSGDDLRINTDMLDPAKEVRVNRNNIEVMQPSDQSMMPAGLLDHFNEEEIKDLMAYLLSRGDRKSAMFAGN